MVERVVEFENGDPAASHTSEAVQKTPFVAPSISVPVDVLSATTFFQSVESGATG